MQPVCSSHKRKYVSIYSEVEVNKMREKHAILVFFKCFLNTRAMALILELDEGNIYRYVKFEYQSGNFNIDRVFKK